jgi:four helix bundle protein
LADAINAIGEVCTDGNLFFLSGRNQISPSDLATDRWHRRCIEQSVLDPPDLLPRVKRFALDSLAFYRRLPKLPECQVCGKQYLRSSHAVFLNYRAAKRGRSRREFISKLAIVVEEIDECVGNLEYMRDGCIGLDSTLFNEANELCAIFTASLATARKNYKRESARIRASRKRSSSVPTS